MLFKWENLQNQQCIKYFFSPLLVCIYIYHLSTVVLQIFFTESVMMNSGIALSMKDECHAAEHDQNEGY